MPSSSFPESLTCCRFVCVVCSKSIQIPCLQCFFHVTGQLLLDAKSYHYYCKVFVDITGFSQLCVPAHFRCAVQISVSSGTCVVLQIPQAYSDLFTVGWCQCSGFHQQPSLSLALSWDTCTYHRFLHRHFYHLKLVLTLRSGEHDVSV